MIKTLSFLRAGAAVPRSVATIGSRARFIGNSTNLATQLFDMSGKTAVITGGSGGLGMSIAKYFLAAGSSVALIDNNMPRLEPAQAALEEWYQSLPAPAAVQGEINVTSWACDIADADQVANTITSIRLHNQKPLNVLVNCAGYCENFPATEYPHEQLKRLIDVNLNGSMFMATEFARSVMKDQEAAPEDDLKASIILIASMSGVIVNHPQPQTPYNVSKAGVIHMAKSLASEWAHHNIRVNALSPGYIMTPLTRSILENDPMLKANWESQVPLGRMAEPHEFAGPVLFMASEASSYMTGNNIVVDGGFTVW